MEQPKVKRTIFAAFRSVRVRLTYGLTDISGDFDATPFFGFEVTPRSLARAFAKAQKWADEMEKIILANGKDSGADVVADKSLTTASSIVGVTTVAASLRTGARPATRRASPTGPSPGLTASVVVGAATGSVGAGIATGLVLGADPVESVVGGAVGGVIGKVFDG